MTLNCPSALHNYQEGVFGDCSVQLGIGSDPGVHQVWPFNPGPSHYTSELSQFSPIWGATDSPPLLPAQYGWMKFLHYPYLLDIYSLHSGQEAMGDHLLWGKVGGGTGE